MVFPHGKHGGTYSHPMPVTRTYSRPCRQAWLDAGFRPSPHHTTGGRRGSNAARTDSGSRRAKDERRMTGTPTGATMLTARPLPRKGFFR